MRLLIVAACAVMLVCLGPVAAFAFGPFHPAATEAEKALARIIQKAQDDKELPRYLLEHSSPDPVRDKENSTMFTASLLAALNDSEADQVHRRCGGRYIPGEVCGIKYNPITCLDFERPMYVFRTDSSGEFSNGDSSAVIAYRLPEGQQIVATYNMLRVDGMWKVDGVDCTVGGSFNM